MKSASTLIFAIAISSSLPLTVLGADGDRSSATGNVGVEDRGTESSFFQILDANKDGSIDQTEANKSAQVKADFKAIDTNHDGKISAEEWAIYSGKIK